MLNEQRIIDKEMILRILLKTGKEKIITHVKNLRINDDFLEFKTVNPLEKQRTINIKYNDIESVKIVCLSK